MDINTISEKLVNVLIDRHYHISCAESLTGGMLSCAITSVSGASSVLESSYVTYSERAKHDILGVALGTIACYNVVSEQVALEMVRGLKTKTQADICIAVTGVAGPQGGSDEIPVGMVCFGYVVCGEEYSETIRFGDIGRDEVRQSTVYHALEKVLELIK